MHSRGVHGLDSRGPQWGLQGARGGRCSSQVCDSNQPDNPRAASRSWCSWGGLVGPVYSTECCASTTSSHTTPSHTSRPLVQLAHTTAPQFTLPIPHDPVNMVQLEGKLTAVLISGKDLKGDDGMLGGVSWACALCAQLGGRTHALP